MLYGVSGINGLGRTNGVEESPKFLSKKFCFKKIFGIDLSTFKHDQKRIFSEVNFRKKNFFVGGDHFVTYALCKGFFAQNPYAKLLVFDAHPDLMKPMKEPTHEEWLRALVEEKIVEPGNILIVGVRKNSENVDKSELKYALKKGIKIIYSGEFKKKKDQIFDFLNNNLFYFSFDVDVFDESFFKSTGYPEKRGLLGKDIFSFLMGVLKNYNLKTFDLVEYNPFLDRGKKDLKTIEKIFELFSKNGFFV